MNAIEQRAGERLLETMSRLRMEPGVALSQVWRHRESGNVYVLLFVGVQEATLDYVAVYERVDIARCNGPASMIWVRPLEEFLDRFENCNRTASEVET